MDPINKFATDANAGVDKAANKLHNGIRDTYQGARAAERRHARKRPEDSRCQARGQGRRRCQRCERAA